MPPAVRVMQLAYMANPAPISYILNPAFYILHQMYSLRGHPKLTSLLSPAELTSPLSPAETAPLTFAHPFDLT